MRSLLPICLCLLLGSAVASRAGEATVLEAERILAGRGEALRDKTASGGQTAIVRWGRMLLNEHELGGPEAG
jgi:hypothetical protein